MHTSRRSLLVAVIATAVLLVPSPADAQLGGFIKRRLEDKVADRVLGEGSERRAAPPKFDETVLEITDQRLAQLIRGVDAEVEALASARAAQAQAKQQGQARKAAYDAEMKEFERKSAEFDAVMKKYQQCTMDAVGRGIANSGGPSPEMRRVMEKFMALSTDDREALQERIAKRQERMQAAQARGDNATVARLTSEMEADLQKTAGISFADLQAASNQSAAGTQSMQADMAKCGPEPVPPVEPKDPTAATIDVRDSVRTAAVRASGFDESQYNVIRERVAAWLASKEKDRSLGSYGFTDDELKVLDGQHEALKARRAALLGEDRDNSWNF